MELQEQDNIFSNSGSDGGDIEMRELTGNSDSMRSRIRLEFFFDGQFDLSDAVKKQLFAKAFEKVLQDRLQEGCRNEFRTKLKNRVKQKSTNSSQRMADGGNDERDPFGDGPQEDSS